MNRSKAIKAATGITNKGTEHMGFAYVFCAPLSDCWKCPECGHSIAVHAALNDSGQVAASEKQTQHDQ